MARMASFFCGVVIGLAPLAATAEVGVLAAVNNDMTGERPSENVRQIFIKERLVADERIETSANGGGQVLFLDQTSLTIAPNSSVVLDKYVYDPDTQTGELGISVLRGTLRFVGGRITKSSPAVIRTPSATIGIRGGIGSTTVNDDGTSRHFHLAGVSSTIEANGETLTITREGGYADIGEGVEYLGVATTDVMNATLSLGAGQGDGGSSAGAAAGSSSGLNDVAAAGSDADGAVTDAPFSTSGERQEPEFGEVSVAEVETPNDEFAEQNLADEMEPVAFMDAVVFFGDHDVTVQTIEGVINDVTPFQLLFSLQDNEGTVVFGIPETGDFFGEGEGTTQGFETSDGFVVVGEGAAITAEPGTLFGGNVNGNFAITNQNLSGNYSVDYRNSPFIEITEQIDGQVTNLQGIDVPVDGVQETTDLFRETIMNNSML